MGLLVLIIAAAFTAGSIAIDQRDFELIKSQEIAQGTLLLEDYSACLMDIDLHGQTITANTSCSTGFTFPAGTQISVVQDPADSTRYLAVAPGQDWDHDPVDTIIIGSMMGLMIAGFTVVMGHRLLPRPKMPNRQPAIESAPLEQTNDQARYAFSAALENTDAALEQKKHQIAGTWSNLAETNIRIRGTLLGILLIAVTVLAFIFGAANTAELSRDRYLVRSEPVLTTVMLEIGGRGNNAKVRLGIKVYELEYGLRWELLRETGQEIQVVKDPADPERLIPVEIDNRRGLIGFVLINLPTILVWIASISFLVWMFIPDEIVALAERINKRLGIKKRTPRH